MTPKPSACVWELTMGCNLRCAHCGSSCEAPLFDELTPQEALNVAEQIAALGVKWVTLSGGEPLLREDWPDIALRLRRCGVAVTMISNGWMVDEIIVQKMKGYRLAVVALSVDGPPEIHDRIRKAGSFERIEKAFHLFHDAAVPCRAITTVTRENFDALFVLKEYLIQMRVPSWQIQLGVPMGNLRQRPEWLLAPEQVDELLDFCLGVSRDNRIKIHLTDCIGYYTRREMEIKMNTFGRKYRNSCWNGCTAGIHSFGVLHNGDIVGCTSIRDRRFIEGNLRTKKLEAIWNDPKSFTWRRNLTPQNLTGSCRICKYASRCLGGCSTMRQALHGTIESENEYCVYHHDMEKSATAIHARTDFATLIQEAESEIRDKKYQLAALKLEHVVNLCPKNANAWKMKGFVDFFNENYDLCEAANLKALELTPNDPYALRGLALALWHLGQKDTAILLLRQSIDNTTNPNLLADALHDWRCLYENQKK